MNVGPPARGGTRFLVALGAAAYAASRGRRMHEPTQPATAPELYPVQVPQPDLPGTHRRSAAAGAARWAASVLLTAGAEELVRRNPDRVVRAGGLALQAAARRWPSLERHFSPVDASPARPSRWPQVMRRRLPSRDTGDRSSPAVRGRSD